MHLSTNRIATFMVCDTTYNNKRQRQRHLLLKEVQHKWHKEQSVNEAERQLSTTAFQYDAKTHVEFLLAISLQCKPLADMSVTFARKTL